RAFLACLLIAAGSGCGRDEASEGAPAVKAPDRGAELGAAARSKEPIAGPLTVERMVAAKSGVRPYDPWGKAWAHLVASAGEPTSSAGDTFTWMVAVGESCHLLEVRRAEDRVDAVTYGAYEKGTSQHERCAASGK
ncbi:MAG TPA: hypothetical protein VFU21_19435, partial [Kofleriaceae bacterium]|nr:hypothetical protein [Kofleriaceae bacterium]